MEPILRSAQALKQEAEEIGFEGKDILEYVKEQQKLDREERAAWRETQKMQAQADVELAKIRAEAEAEEKKRADELQTEETPDQFVIRLKNYLAKWLELSGSSPQNFDALVDLIVKEQFINACSEDLAMYLLERGPKDLVELTTWAQKYLIAHKEQLGKSKATVQPRRVDQKKTTQSKPDSSQGRQRLLQCYRCRGFGHRQSECGTKISPGKDQKGSSTLVSQSSQKKTRAMVAQLDEDGEKAFTCVEVEGTRSRSNSKKSGTEGSTNSDRAVYSAVCRAQSNDGQTYVGVGKLNGRPVKVLRDTGCTGMIVDRALVPEVLVIPGSSGSLQMVDHTLIDVPLANVYLDSPYYKGHCRVMCVSSPVYPVIIGNVRGARRMLPDPDWKAEDFVPSSFLDASGKAIHSSCRTLLRSSL